MPRWTISSGLPCADGSIEDRRSRLSPSGTSSAWRPTAWHPRQCAPQLRSRCRGASNPSAGILAIIVTNDRRQRAFRTSTLSLASAQRLARQMLSLGRRRICRAGVVVSLGDVEAGDPAHQGRAISSGLAARRRIHREPQGGSRPREEARHGVPRHGIPSDAHLDRTRSAHRRIQAPAPYQRSHAPSPWQARNVCPADVIPRPAVHHRRRRPRPFRRRGDGHAARPSRDELSPSDSPRPRARGG